VPNIPPGGVHGRHAALWKNPTEIHARVAGVWKSADFVWGAKAGGWVLLWAKNAGSPATATAVYTPTQVVVSWVAAVPAVADTYKVYRPDGSLAGSVAAPALTFTDLDPRPVTGTYKVVGVLGGVDSTAQTATNSLALAMPAATLTATVQSPGASQTVKLDWTAAAIGRPDFWNVYRVVGATATLLSQVAGTAVTYTDTTPLHGTAAEYAVTPVLSTLEGTDKTVTVNVPAKPPTAVNLAAINPPATGAASANQLQLTWTAAPVAVTGYEVETSTNGTTWTASATDTSGVIFVSAVPLYARVRSLSAGGSSAWVQDGPTSPHPNSPPGVPGGVVLTALSSPLSTLQLVWTAGTGATSYEVETYVASPGGPWTAHSDDTTPALWTTTVAGYMRVRSVSAGGVSAYVQAGPVTPINDVTPPPAPVITTFKPESSYGRMVVRFTTANVTDFGAYRVDYNTNGGAYTNGSWVNANPNTATAVVLGRTYAAGETAGVRVYYRDDLLNVSAADTATYALVASPKIVDANDSATWRGSAWRTDGTSGSTGVMHGRTSSGENYGCWFYGEAIQDFVSTHTVISATCNYARESSQGSGSAIQPGFWVHSYATQPAGSPVAAFVDGPVLGSGVARSGTTTGTVSLSAAQIAELAGTGKGLGVYRSTSNTNDADAASFYMKLNPFSSTSGRVTLNHLG
jgi:hypothetical protein